MRRWIMAVAAVLLAGSARAEVTTVRAGEQYGLSSLPLMIMEDRKLVEQRAKEAGLADLTVTWVRLGGPGPIAEALISGDLDFGAGGVPGLITLWSRTRGTAVEVRGVGSVVNMPMELLTTNPRIQSIRDFGRDDKIAVTTIKVSNQALLLEMAAAKEWGAENYAKLDPLTVSLAHPDAVAALASGNILTAHFSALPFQYTQRKDARVRRIVSSYDILGGPASNTVAFTTKRFHDANPRVYAAFAAALGEAIDIVNRDKRAAVEAYKRMANSRESVDELLAMISEPEVQMTIVPTQTFKMAKFMAETGRIKVAPRDWSEMFFENVRDMPGN